MPQFPHRRLSREHMDDPRATREELDEALRFIRIVNARLGGTAAALWHFKRWAQSWATSPHQTIRILDIGAGSADIPLAIAQWAERNDHRVHITAVDLH